MSEWQDISTAPKDGSEVLLYRGDWAGRVAVCYWCKVNEEWQTGLFSPFLSATHWQPLPAPPVPA